MAIVSGEVVSGNIVSEVVTTGFPNALKKRIDGYSVTPVLVGKSTASVFRLEHPQRKPLYLKISDDAADRELRAEADRLKWIAGRIPTPRLVSYVESQGGSYLLTSALPGRDASVAMERENKRSLVRLLAQGLREIHRLPIEDCPFDQRLRRKIELAHDRLLRKQVDESDFDQERQGKTALELFDELINTRRSTEDLVFTHGDYCFPNIILNRGRIRGFVDWSRGGVADRYQDLALAARSIYYNLGRDWTPLFFREYGIADPDERKLEFYKLLDEFF